jgi:uncharacterized protein (TIGR02217 family)
LPEAIRSHEVFETIRDHWLVMGGPASTWPFRDPLDFASVALPQPNMAPELAADDQSLGFGTGARTQFQLLKTYTRGSTNYVRDITLPIVSSVVVFVNGIPPEDLSTPYTPLAWTVSRPGGVVTFDGPVPLGLEVTAGYLFDVEVRFESDESFEGIAKAYTASGVSDLNLISVRSC